MISCMQSLESVLYKHIRLVSGIYYLLYDFITFFYEGFINPCKLIIGIEGGKCVPYIGGTDLL